MRVLLLLLALCWTALAQDALGSCAALPVAPDSQQAAAANCTPPRPYADAQKPFCFAPDTVSQEARRFLSNTSAATLPFKVLAGAAQAASLAELRTTFAAVSRSVSVTAEERFMQSTRNETIGGVPVLVAVPKGVKEAGAADTRLLLYIHGGGYIAGSCYSQLGTPAATAAAANLTIVCPEYRLAPEHPFPAGLTDVVAVYKALLQQGYQAHSIVLLGDSAGGGMVPAVAIQLQREGVALPAALGMFSPWADMRNRGDTVMTLIAADPLFDGTPGAENNPRGVDLPALYLGPDADPALFVDPLASPVEADYASLFPNGSLPPTLIQVGLRELLLSDAVRLYHAMRAAAPAPGHRVVLSAFEGMWHVFQTFLNVPEAVAASTQMAEHFTFALGDPRRV